VARAAGTDAIRYFDGVVSVAELDDLSTRFAAALVARGFERGDRVALYLQNIPQFVVAVVGTWKAGGIVVPVNPMLRPRELAYVLADSGASVLVARDHLVPSHPVDVVITTSALDLQSRNDDRAFAGVERNRRDDTEDMLTIIGSTDPGEQGCDVAPGASVEPDELIDFCRARMAAYKYPRIVELVDELPKTATGKILRRELRNPT